MSDDNELERLEKIIDSLLNKYNKLEEVNKKHIATIEEKNTEIEELKAKLDGLANEKDHVQKRISGILRSIEDWESGRVDEEGKEEETQAEIDPEKPQEEWPKLFGTDRSSV
ncbi:MAG: hypothetical protein ACLFV2_10190 [Desulfurivibrionaceae bacterium]